MATINGTTRWASALLNSTCAISGGSDVVLPMPAPNSSTPATSSTTSVPAANSSATDPAICTRWLAQATSRRSLPCGISQPTSVRPAIAAAVARPIRIPATGPPNTGTSSEKRCAINPICANSPSAIAAARVRKRRSRQSEPPGRPRSTGTVVPAEGVRISPSCTCPNDCGVWANTWSARNQTVATMTAPTTAAAMGKPQAAMAATHSGEKTTPPMLAPL